MKTILTIDFDIIMGPSLRAYNGLIDGQTYIENVPENDLLKFARADLTLYRKLTDYLLKICENKKILFIENHDQILDTLDDEEKYDIINIDFHHDLGYHLDQIDVKEDSEYNCANWVLMTYDKKVLNTYTWIRSNRSTMPREENRCPVIDYDVNNFDFNTLPNPDTIVICYSAQWIPQQYRPLYFLWMDLLSDKLNTNFTIERDL